MHGWKVSESILSEANIPGLVELGCYRKLVMLEYGVLEEAFPENNNAAALNFLHSKIYSLPQTDVNVQLRNAEKEPHSGGGLTALMECAAPLGDGQQKCGPH